MKLTEAQKRCLASVAAGTVTRHFDVYGGYRWIEGNNATAWRSSSSAAPSPIAALAKKGMITVAETERPFSGRQIAKYELTEAGRTALKEQGR